MDGVNVNANRPEPAPVHVPGSVSAWQEVIRDVDQMNKLWRTEPMLTVQIVTDMTEREQFGFNKYGTYLQVGNGRNTLIDAYQEALDLTVYLRLLYLEQPSADRWNTYLTALKLVMSIGYDVHS